VSLIKTGINSVVRRSYYLTRKVRYRKLERQLSGRPPLVVFQMGKVGSSSVTESLKAIDVPFELFHVHVLTRDGIEGVHREYRHATRVYGRPAIQRHIVESDYLRRQLDGNDSSVRWKVISLVRDPVARNISTFFHSLCIYFPELCVDDRQIFSEERIPELLETYINRWDGHHTPLHWFQTQLEPVFDIDVYDMPFPKDKGYQIIESGAVSLLLLRLESLNATARPAMEDFLGLQGVKLDNHNVAEKKAYASAYKAFQKQLKLPGEYLDTLYDSKYARHFYTEDEIAGFRKRWQVA